MAGNIVEKIKIDSECQLLATAAGSSVSKLYDMRDYDEAMFYVSAGSTGTTISTHHSVDISLVESTAATAAGTTLIGGKATICILTSLTTSIPVAAGCNMMVFQSGSAASDTGATTGDSFRFGLGTNIMTFNFSSVGTAIAPSGATNSATLGHFGSGSAVNVTANTGGTALIDNLRTALESTKFTCGGPNVFRFSTPDTSTLKIQVQNSELGPIFYASGVAETRFRAFAQGAAGIIPVRADELTSSANKRFIGVQWSTTNQPIPMSVTCIRTKGRYMPTVQVGRVST